MHNRKQSVFQRRLIFAKENLCDLITGTDPGFMKGVDMFRCIGVRFPMKMRWGLEGVQEKHL